MDLPRLTFTIRSCFCLITMPKGCWLTRKSKASPSRPTCGLHIFRHWTNCARSQLEVQRVLARRTSTGARLLSSVTLTSMLQGLHRPKSGGPTTRKNSTPTRARCVINSRLQGVSQAESRVPVQLRCHEDLQSTRTYHCRLYGHSGPRLSLDRQRCVSLNDVSPKNDSKLNLQ